MPKKYKIEVPIYARPVSYLSQINQGRDIEIIVYGGIPDSPFNGGRVNYALDGLLLKDRTSTGLSAKQMEAITSRFYDTVQEINSQGMTFCAACTNMFVDPQELVEKNLKPLQRLVESGEQHGVKNGVIINNALLEETLRREYGGRMLFISSCTKFVSAHKMLSPGETMAMYRADCGRYDYVVLTPQDSRREKLVRSMGSEQPHKIIAIANSYCANGCNAYHHYELASRQNKVSLERMSMWDVLGPAIRFLPHSMKCSAYWYAFFPVELEKIAGMQLKAGIVNFKLGRGLGVEKFEKLIELIKDFEEKHSKGPAVIK